VIYCKSQAGIAKHVICDGLLHYRFIIQFAGARIFKTSVHLAKLQAKWLCHMPHSSYTFIIKDAELAREVK